jgi:hypothetical protein
MVKPVLGIDPPQIVNFQVGDATLPPVWNIENGQTNIVHVGFLVPDTDGLPYLTASATKCGSGGFSLTTTGDVGSGLTITITNLEHVVSIEYCIVVELYFSHEPPTKIHAVTFRFTVTAQGQGTATPSPVERINGYIAVTEDGSENLGNTVKDRTISSIVLSSNPDSSITYDQLLTLTASGGPDTYWYMISGVTSPAVDDFQSGGWVQGDGATGTLTIPISAFATAGQGGQINVVATVEWSVTNPDRRALRGLQGEEDGIPPTGSATFDVTVGLDPASVEAAAAAASSSGGYPPALKVTTTTMIAATGAVAAVAML